MNRSDPLPGDGQTSFQVLTTRFDVTAEGARARAALRFLPTGVAHAFPPRHRRRIAISHGDDGYEITFDNRPPHAECDAVLIMEWLHQYLTETALEAHGQGVALSAGSAVIAGRRVLFAGGDRVARTNLALWLLLDGHDVESGRYSAIDGGGGSGLAFRFAVAAHTLSEIPALGMMPGSVPSFVDQQDITMYLISPSDLGFEPPVTRGPIDAIFVLDVNRGGDTRVAPAHGGETMEQLVSDGITWRSRRGDWIGPLAAAVERAKTYRLFLGDAAAAGRLIVAKAAAL